MIARTPSRALACHVSAVCSASHSAARATRRRATSRLVELRPALDAVGRDEMHRVAVAAHDAGLGRHVVGDDPVGALGLALGLWRTRSRSAVSAAKPITSGGRLPGRSAAMVLRMSGFSTSSSLGEALAPFLIFSVACVATRQSATAAAKMAMSAGSAARTASSISRAVSTRTTFTPAGSAQVGRAADQRHVGAERRGLGGDRRALLAGGAVGDVAHRIDGLVRRAAGDEHVAAGERAIRLPPRRGARPRDASETRPLAARGRGTPIGLESPPAARAPRRGGRGRPRRARPSRRRWARRNGCRRPRAGRRCAGWPDGATCAGSWRGPPAPACRWPSARALARSSAWPPAILASRSAVAGATTIRSASRDRRMWPISRSSSRSNRSVNTRSLRQRADRQRRDELLRRPGHDRAHADARARAGAGSAPGTCRRQCRRR